VRADPEGHAIGVVGEQELVSVGRDDFDELMAEDYERGVPSWAPSGYGRRS
jgi:hypothetical protein